jgi:DNA-binding transcriptional LysR family regulator
LLFRDRQCDFLDFMRGLNPDQLNAFIEVTRLASFSRAAERLNLSPSAISLQIRSLETRLGVQLIERLGKRAHPTPAGRELLQHAEAILRQADLAAEAMRSFAQTGMGTVRLGSGTAALAYLLPPVLRKLRRAHPKLGLAISTNTTDTMLAQLHANEIDLSIVWLPIDEAGLDVTFLREDPLVAVFAAGTRKRGAAQSDGDRLGAGRRRRAKPSHGARQHGGDQERGGDRHRRRAAQPARKSKSQPWSAWVTRSA